MRSLVESINESLDKFQMSKVVTEWVNNKLKKAIKDKRIKHSKPFNGYYDTTILSVIDRIIVKITDTSVETTVVLKDGHTYASDLYTSTFYHNDMSVFSIAGALGTTIYSGMYGITEKAKKDGCDWIGVFEQVFSQMHDTTTENYKDFESFMNKAGYR